MRNLYLGLLFFSTVTTAHGQDTRAADGLKERGFTRCAPVVSTLTQFVYNKDTFGFINLWNAQRPNQHSTQTITAKEYSDGVSFAVIAGIPQIAGGCDGQAVQILLNPESCAKTRDVTFKDWKYYSDIAGTPIYEDPTSSNSNAILYPFKGACLIIKTVTLFNAVP